MLVATPDGHGGAFMGCVAETLLVVVFYGHDNATPVQAYCFIDYIDG